MRTIVIAIVVLVAGVSLLRAAEPPELEEWFRIEGRNGFVGGIFTYLPDFDTVNNGRNAIATINLAQTGAHDWPTWYLRSQYDTVNQFDWPNQATPQITKVDLNGDGIYEYLNYVGGIHQTTANGVVPQREPVAVYPVIQSAGTGFQRIPVDIDNDSYADIIADQGYFSPPWLFTILWGGPDLTQLRTQIVYRRPYAEPKVTEFLAAVLPQKSAEGKVRIITRSYEESGFQQAKWISYVLRELTAIREADTVRFEMVTLDSISDAIKRPSHFYGLFAGDIVQGRPDQPMLFMVPLLGEQNSYLEVYDVSNGRFTPVHSFIPWQTIVYPHALQGSINGDEYADYFLSVIDRVALYAGGRGFAIDTTPIAFFRHPCEIGEGIVTMAIGDVTGDGVGDLASAYNNDAGCFVIYKGIANRTVGVPVAGFVHRPFDMQQNYPNPVSSDRRTILPFSTEKPQHLVLALYDLSGRFIGELFSGYVPEGDHEVELDFARYHLAPGMYVLRLGNGEHVRERGMLLQ